jgi:excisionase family DNA binding protein
MTRLSNRIGPVPLHPDTTAKDWPVPNQNETPDRIGDRWLSVDEIASYLGVKRDTVYKWIARRKMPAHKVGRLWKFRRAEVDDWICSKNARGDTPPGPARIHRRSDEADSLQEK